MSCLTGAPVLLQAISREVTHIFLFCVLFPFFRAVTHIVLALRFSALFIGPGQGMLDPYSPAKNLLEHSMGSMQTVQNVI